MSEIHKPFRMAPPDGKPVETVVASLEKLLEEAKQGEIMGFVGVIIHRGHKVHSVMTLGEASALAFLLGGMRLLEKDIIEEFW
jgi:hypothetical protein